MTGFTCTHVYPEDSVSLQQPGRQRPDRHRGAEEPAWAVTREGPAGEGLEHSAHSITLPIGTWHARF